MTGLGYRMHCGQTTSKLPRAKSVDNHCSNGNGHHDNNDKTEEQVLHVVEDPTKSSNILAQGSDAQGIPALLVAQVAG